MRTLILGIVLGTYNFLPGGEKCKICGGMEITICFAALKGGGSHFSCTN